MPYKLPYIEETEPRWPSQQEAGRGMAARLHNMAEPNIPSIEPKVLERVIPRLPRWMIPIWCEMRLRDRADVVGAYKERRTLGLRFRVA